MEPRIWLAFLVCVLASSSSDGHRDFQSNAIPSHAEAIESEHKLLLDCQHTDYRTYIKCLKREKRHGLGNTRACLDECFEQNCTSSACLRECHSHCRKRLIETYSKTVETSYDCSEDGCKQTSGSLVPNITANIHIENILPNVTHCKNDSDATKIGSGNTTGPGGSSSSTGTLPKIDINNVINNQFGSGSYPGSDCACRKCGFSN